MAKGVTYVHPDDFDELEKRVRLLEAELNDDPKTGRPSLRRDVKAKLDAQNKDVMARLDAQDKSLTFIKRVAMGVLVTLLGYVIVTGASTFLRHDQKSSDQQTQGK